MTDWSERYAEEIEDLRRVRDELRVQLHLGKAEAREGWEKLEKSWHRLEAKLKVVGEESRESLDDIEEAAGHLVEEIKKGYKHLRDLL